LQRRENENIVVYRAERRSNNHVFREQVIETVDVPRCHLIAVMAIHRHRADERRRSSGRKVAEQSHLVACDPGNSRAMMTKTMAELLRHLFRRRLFDG